jgi:hypothetical protein
MSHKNSNSDRSKNGNSFEKTFTELTGISKIRKKDKPRFTNSHGNEQIIDFDFYTEINGVKIYVDVSTTFRSDRLKQKSYNALMMKNKISSECKFYMVVKSLTENGKKKKPNLIEGIDNVYEISEFVDILNQ